MSRPRKPPAPVAAPAPPPPAASGLDRPAGALTTAFVVLVVFAAPAWMMADPLGGFRFGGLTDMFNQALVLADPFGCARLSLDDFPYVAESRTWTDLKANLLVPHNAHVVPIFRLLTYGLTRAAGSLARLPVVLGLAAYAALLAAMAAVGHLAGWETRRLGVGLIAMAFGLSSVLQPVASWYSASQALWAGVGVLAMLMLLQEWRGKGGTWRLALALLAAAAAPLVWAGGYTAGPTGLAFLWADGRPRCRRAAVLPLIATGLTGLALLAVAGRQIAAPENFHGRSLGQAFSPLRAVAHTAQAVPEVLVFKNLGIDVTTTPTQGFVLSAFLVAAWAWSRSGVDPTGSWHPPRPNPLEAAGAVLAISGFWLAYAARGYHGFASLRDLSWYQAIPELGAALFAVGWWAGLHGVDPHLAATARPARFTRREALALLALVVVIATIHAPRCRRLAEGSTHPLLESEKPRFPIPSLVWWRTRYLLQELSERQHRFLAQLDQAEARALKSGGVSREALRETFGRVVGPGMPGHVEHINAIDMLALPESIPGRSIDPARLRTAFGVYFLVEPEPRPYWLEPGDPWPPPGR